MIQKILDRLLPREVIGDKYLRRWHIIPPNRWLSVYIHKFEGDDYGIIHDHPAASLSIRLKGVMREDYTTQLDHDTLSPGSFILRTRFAPRVCFRSAAHAHRLMLANDLPCWTLFIFFRKPKNSSKHWGFYFPDGWMSWQELRDRYYGSPEYYMRWHR